MMCLLSVSNKSIITKGEGELEPCMSPLETLGGANLLSYKALYCLIYAKDSDLRWFYKLAKGISLVFVTPSLSVFFISD